MTGGPQADDPARISPLAPFRKGDILARKFRVDRLVGVGGMGLVIGATNLDLDQPVAIKFLLSDASDGPVELARRAAVPHTHIERFLREARVAAKLRSEHVARVYDVDTLATGEPFIVMELLEGITVGDLRKQTPLLSVDEAIEIVLQACEGLAEAHALGIVHRDVKPSNLFVTRRSDERVVVKLLDFGLAKFVESRRAAGARAELTELGTGLGTPRYMAPEQVDRARNVDARADVWATGVVLYELLAGRPPYPGKTLGEYCASILRGPPPSLRELRVETPDAVVAIIERCLRRDPDARPRNAAEIAAALRPFARGASAMTGAAAAEEPRPPATGIVTVRARPAAAAELPVTVGQLLVAPAQVEADASAAECPPVAPRRVGPRTTRRIVGAGLAVLFAAVLSTSLILRARAPERTTGVAAPVSVAIAATTVAHDDPPITRPEPEEAGASSTDVAPARPPRSKRGRGAAPRPHGAPPQGELPATRE